MSSMKCSIHDGNGRSSQMRVASKEVPLTGDSDLLLPTADYESKYILPSHLRHLAALDRVPYPMLGPRCNTESCDVVDGIGSTEVVFSSQRAAFLLVASLENQYVTCPGLFG